jgi:hypothetical protein
MKQILLAITLVLAAYATTAQGEIGWTYDQLAKKYTLDEKSRGLLIDGGKGGWASYLVWTFGKVTDSNVLTLPEWYIYTASNCNKDSHSKLTPYQTCATITYERPWNGNLTQGDIQKLLAENACGQKWKAPVPLKNRGNRCQMEGVSALW